MKYLIEVFIPYREMRRHICALLHPSIEDNVTTQPKDEESGTLQLKGGGEVTTRQEKDKEEDKDKNAIIQWKDALLADLNFVGIVVRLYFHRLNSSLSFNPSLLSLFFLLEINKILCIAYTNAYIGWPHRHCHRLNTSRVCYSLLACPRSVALGSAFCSYFYLYCCTTDNDAHENTLRQSKFYPTSPACILQPYFKNARELAQRRDTASV
jgi:hypothetical protein